MAPKRRSGGGAAGGGAGASASERGAEEKNSGGVTRQPAGRGGSEGAGPIAGGGGGSMPPPPLPPPQARSGGAAGAGPSGSDAGDDAARPTVTYAELRRVSMEAPTTATLPTVIPLQSPGDTSTISFGRHRGNDWQLDCPRVPSLLSRQHAELILDQETGVHSVMDKNTLNGTYLNGNLIPRGPCPLQHGDVIAFGGPANVLRDNKTLRNSFRYEYRRPHTVERWKSLVEEAEAARRERAAHAGGAAGLAPAAAEDEEQRRPAKRARRTGNSTGAGGDGDGVPVTTGAGVGASPFTAAELPLAGGIGGSSSGVPSQSTQSTLPTQPRSTQSTQPTQPSSQLTASLKPETTGDDLAVAAKVLGDVAPGAAPLGHRTPGTTVVKLSRRDLVTVQRVASKMVKRSQEFVCNGLTEIGMTLADTVVPLGDHDEVALKDTIAENSKDVKLFSSLRAALTVNAANSQNAVDADMTQATQEYVMPPFPPKTSVLAGAVLPFLRQVCQEALEIHVSPTGLVSFGLKLLSAGTVWDSEAYGAMEKSDTAASASFMRGDLIAEAVALALWPQQQLGWEGKKGEEIGTSENVHVFASSISEIDGHGCDIGGAGCQAIAEGILAPRKTVDGVWVFNECLRRLSLGKNPRLGDVGASALAAALKPRLGCNKVMMFNKTLTVLDLSSCGIGPEGAMAVADALKMVPTPDGDWSFPSNLRALRLSGNRIESKGARAIAGLLGPKENKKTGKWTFNPSLAMIDISDNFSGMNDLVAEAFAKALQPRPVKSSKHGRDGEDTKQAYSVNVALLELHLCGHAFRDGVKTIQNSLDPKCNGSEGAAGSSVRVVFEHPGREGASESKKVMDSDGNSHELVLPITTGCAAERRPLSHWQWRPWNAPLSTSRDDPSVAPETQTTPASGGAGDVGAGAGAGAGPGGSSGELPGWHRALVEDHHPNGSMHSWSVGFAFRNVLLQRMEGGDSILSEEPCMAAAGLPQWLDDELRCVICTDVFVNPYSVSGCGHTFCHDCISHWLSTRSNQCPICRHRLQVPTSVALTPCHMSQRMLDHYVLPHLPPKDVEARRERAREVRDNAAERAAEARRASTAAGEDGRGGSFAATAAAAIAMVAGGGGGASLRVSGASNISALQQMIQMHTQRALRAAQEARAGAGRAASNPAAGEPPTQGEGGGGRGGGGGAAGSVPMHEAMAQSLRSAQEVLRSLQDSRRRREEQLAAVVATAGEQGIHFSTAAAPAAGGAGAAAEDPLAAVEALLMHRRTAEAPTEAPVEQPDWNAVSSSVETATPCRHCRIVIPPRFLRMKRTVAVSGVETNQYFHANYDCLRTVHHEIRAAPDIAALPELSEQERRVVSALRAVIASPIEIARGRNRNAGGAGRG